MRATCAVIIAFVSIAGCKPNAPPPPAIPEPYKSGEQLISAMHDRYADRWYHALTFTQTTTTIGEDGKQNQATWYEALLLPSRLRVDFHPIPAGNGALVRGDTQYVMQRGNVARVIPRTNELLLLGFDVYHLAPSFTVEWLRRLGFDMSRIRQDVWQGRQVYVVGAASPSDLQSRQFWVDREHLLFVRLVEPSPNGDGTQDVRFGNYKQIGRAWVAPLVELYHNGRLTFKEEYLHMRIDAPLDTMMFFPATWTSAKHWYEQR